jgi:Flp pilus assembly protein TadG
MRAQDGGVTVEVVLLTPVLMVLFAFVIMTGRIGEARGAVIHASEQAARAASMMGDPVAARAAAEDIAVANLEAQEVICRHVAIDVDTSRFARGGDVAVAVTCEADLSAIAFAGLPGTRTISGHAVEVIDLYRGGT